MSLSFEVRPNPSPRTDAERQAILEAPGFGVHFTDHMAVATWTAADGWHDSAIIPYGPFSLDPATAVLHYAQEIFEGLKAYRHADGSVWLFRPDQNAARMVRSSARLALPELPAADFLASLDALIAADAAWVPSAAEQSLYLRPFMFASEAFLGVRPAQRVTYCCIASPAGPYFASGVRPVSIWISTRYTRAAPGGTGAAKCGGNYAASLVAQQEAASHGCDQVMFADAAEHAWLEELGGMNVYVVTADNELLTPGADRLDPGGGHPGVDPDPGRRVRADPGGAQDRHRRAGRRHRVRPGRRAVRLRHRGGDHPYRDAEGRGRDLRRRRRGDGGDHRRAAQEPAGHPVRPGRGHPRLAAPGSLI